MDVMYWWKIDATRNCYRFYIIRLQGDFFSPWRVECEWGRLDSCGRPRRRIQCFDSREEAEACREEEARRREKRGYLADTPRILPGSDLSGSACLPV